MTKKVETALTDDAARFIKVQIRRVQNMMRGGSDAIKGFAQLQVLEIIDRAEGPLSPRDCEETLGHKSNRIACILNDLERKGEIERRSDPKDGRKTVLFLTEAGKCKIREARGKLNHAVESLKTYMGSEQFEEHIALCEKAIEWAESTQKEETDVQNV